MIDFIKSKDPDDVLDFKFDYDAESWLETGDTISTSTWTVSGSDDSLEIDSETQDDTTATVWLSGGTHGVDYTVTNSITTTGGRSKDTSFRLRVRTS